MDDRYAHVKNIRTAIQREDDAKKSLEKYYKKHGYPDPTKPSLQKDIKYLSYGMCPKCGSQMNRKHWWYLWGEKTCKNDQCGK